MYNQKKTLPPSALYQDCSDQLLNRTCYKTFDDANNCNEQCPLAPSEVLIQRMKKKLKRNHNQCLLNLIEKHRGDPSLQHMICMLERELERQSRRCI